MKASVFTQNRMASDALASLKQGALFNGVVQSQSTDGTTKIARITVSLPGVDERTVLVKVGNDLQDGQQVVIQAIPNSAKPGRYTFQVAFSSALVAVKALTSRRVTCSRSIA